MRDLDIDMFFDRDKGEYYCLRCPFTGTEEEVKKLNQMARFRYKCIAQRITTFD
jgi:hypothetical protein